MVCMWKEERGKPYYRFQTEERQAADKMKRRKKFKLVCTGLNCKFWIFQALFNRPDKARNALKALTGGKVEFDRNEDIFYSKVKCIEERKFSSTAMKNMAETYPML